MDIYKKTKMNPIPYFIPHTKINCMVEKFQNKVVEIKYVFIY